jgi:hypothetical protein
MAAVIAPFPTDMGCVEASDFRFDSIFNFASVPNAN